MPDRSRKCPRDPNELAATIIAIATAEKPRENESDKSGKNPAAVELGRLGELKGGKARAQSLTAEQRSDIARKAARAKYGRKD
jgi:hypothetical protein